VCGQGSNGALGNQRPNHGLRCQSLVARIGAAQDLVNKKENGLAAAGEIDCLAQTVDLREELRLSV